MNMKTWNGRYAVGLTVALTTMALLWSYWPTFVELADEWWNNPLYSHGYAVPVFAAFLLWYRRDLMPDAPLQPSWWAVLFLIVACAMRLGAAHFYFSWPDRGSLLFMVFGAALAIGGWAAIRWSWPSIFFLTFMIPFPGFVENVVMRPLQRIATVASTNVLQTMGFFAQADGNVIVLSQADMGIVEACSGLRMLSTFIALTVGACFFIQRPIWQKCVIVLSSIPIAILCNVARITATGVWYEIGDHDNAMVFHDRVGPVMMVMALLLLYAEFKFLDLIFQIDRTLVKVENGENASGPAPAPKVASTAVATPEIASTLSRGSSAR
jgi:exosortase